MQLEPLDTYYEGILIQYEDKAVHIHSGVLMEAHLAAAGNGSLALADHILADYQLRFGKSLRISRHSLAIEILAHFYIENIASLVDSLAEKVPGQVLSGFRRLTGRLIEHVEVIDCGESSVDSNRFLWDAMVPFHALIYTACGQFA